MNNLKFKYFIYLVVLVSLQDIHMRKAFKSAIVFDQQVLSRDTMPAPMLEMYSQCDKPPPLYKLNPYR
jgi:WAS protein family, member 3